MDLPMLLFIPMNRGLWETLIHTNKYTLKTFSFSNRSCLFINNWMKIQMHFEKFFSCSWWTITQNAGAIHSGSGTAIGQGAAKFCWEGRGYRECWLHTVNISVRVLAWTYQTGYSLLSLFSLQLLFFNIMWCWQKLCQKTNYGSVEWFQDHI